jgi:hypothetical protein
MKLDVASNRIAQLRARRSRAKRRLDLFQAVTMRERNLLPLTLR